MDISAFQVEGDAENVAYPAYFDRTYNDLPCVIYTYVGGLVVIVPHQWSGCVVRLQVGNEILDL